MDEPSQYMDESDELGLKSILEAASACPGLVIAAPKSGSGKTLITLALLRALSQHGVRVASIKIGPDYIDPAFHKAASNMVCRNLDLWGMRSLTQKSILSQVYEDQPDCFVVEGVMGVFDGARDGSGATADFVAKTKLPMVLVVDVKGQSASATAVVKGFDSLRADVRVGAVIFNNVG
ncbi:MAG: hypothetical protein R3261_12955, partial [Alphaproteobacteria bacterium]|nr:hypothetical protein [Alphaproteobacteria bacterium]